MSDATGELYGWKIYMKKLLDRFCHSVLKIGKRTGDFCLSFRQREIYDFSIYGFRSDQNQTWSGFLSVWWQESCGWSGKPPKSPKRFIGELISPHFLVYSKEVDTAIVFVLPYGEDRKVQQIFNRPLVQDIALGQNVISSPKIITIHLDISKPEKTCYILYDSLKDYQAQRKFYWYVRARKH